MTGQIDTFGLRRDPTSGRSDGPCCRAGPTEPAPAGPTARAGPPARAHFGPIRLAFAPTLAPSRLPPGRSRPAKMVVSLQRGAKFTKSPVFVK